MTTTIKQPLLLLILAILYINGCNHRQKPAPISDQSPYQKQTNPQKKTSSHRPPKQHQVKKGETLYYIGFKYEIDYKTLAQINHINQPYQIYPGQIIKLQTQAKSHSEQRNKQKTSQVSTQAIRIEPTITATETKPLTKPIASQPKTPTPTQQTTGKVEQTQKPTKPIKQPQTNPTNKQQTNNKPKKPSLNTGKLNWLWPTSKGKILSTFKANDSSRRGISISGKEGQAIKAAESGTVIYSGIVVGYGQLIIIKHNEQYLSAYGHNKKRLVKEGQSVTRGQKIALLGSSGTNINNLQFEIFKNSKPINPLPLIQK